MKKFTTISKWVATLILLNTLVFSLSAQQIYINEFLASNSNVNVDEHNEDDDWVELYNAASSSVNIGGMYLTDDLINPTKWMIPTGTTIPGNGYLLIWCDNQDSQGPLHTNFKLSSSGESIALIASDATTVIDSYSYDSQIANTSKGRQADGDNSWIYFGQPTPEESNATGTTIASMPEASQIGGHFNNSITITITTSTANGTIRYTLDGSEPTESSPAYSNSISINSTTVLRACTFKDGMNTSRTMTHTYLYGVNHTMPIFCVSTNDENFFGDDGIYTLWEEDIMVPCHVELYEADGSFGFRQDLGVQVHGGFSQSYPHKGISFVAKSQYGKNKINYPLFPNLPFDEYGSFILRASGNDWSKLLFRDALAANIVNDISDVDEMIQDPDLEFQAYRPTIVYLNGEYFGIHNLREKLDWRYLKTHYDYEKGEADIVQRRQSLEHGNLDAWSTYRDFIEDADFTDEANIEELKNWIDFDHFVDYFLHNVFIDNNDWPDNNNKGWRLREEDEKWRYFLYDMDRAFGLIPLSGDYNSGDWTSTSLEMVMAPTQTEDHNKEWSTLQLRKLMENDGFRLKFINRMADLLNIMYTPERLIGRINDFEAVYQPEIGAHAEKWWDGDNDYTEDVGYARIFSQNRNDEMWDQFEDFFDSITGQADISLDASPQNGGILHLNTINLRAENFPWSGKYFEGIDVPLRAQPSPGYLFTGWTPSYLGYQSTTAMNISSDEDITANFVLGSTQIAPIVINEINYHSPDTPSQDAGDWIELYNPNNETVDLSGWFLEDESGNYFNLPANTFLGGQGYLVLAEDEVRFHNVHPTVTNFIAGFGHSASGNLGLSNGGEWISINNANRSFIDSVHYDDKLPWPESPDGNGPTLQLISHNLDNALPGSWTASVEVLGTPGAPNQSQLYLGENTVLCSPQTILLNAGFESCTDCTYLWNTGASTMTISVTPNNGNNIYAVTVTDQGGLSQVDEISIDLSPTFNLNHTQQNLICYTGQNGSIDLSVNGTGNYNYQWTNGASTQDVNNLTVGAYVVTVSDGQFCTQTEEITITAPPVINTIGTTTEINCYGELAAISTSTTGGILPYTYSWSDGTINQDISNLSEGHYELTVTDMNNCTNTIDFSFNEPEEMTGTFDIEHTCNGLSTGNIDVDMSGGTGGFYYEWSTGFSASTDDLEEVTGGVYGVTVTDDSGCTWISSAEILDTTNIASIATLNIATCAGDNTGSISLNTSGGIGPYEYLWNTGANSNLINNLPAGDYIVTTTDTNGCIGTQTISLNEPAAIESIATVDNVSCNGLSDGAINLSVTGGTGPIVFLWNTGQDGSAIEDLSGGTFEVSITDENDCLLEENFTITEAALIEASATIQDINCFGNANGAIELNLTGGIPGYEVSWSNGEEGGDIDGLPAGTYTAEVLDMAGCQGSFTYEIDEVAELTTSENIVDPTGGTGASIVITPLGGTPNYSIEWNTGATDFVLTDVQNGVYNYIVTDDNGCQVGGSVSVTNVAVASIAKNELLVYPNPTGGIIHLETNFSEVEIVVYNVLGVLLRKESVRTVVGGIKVDLSALSSGVYFLKVRADGRERVERIVVER